VTLLLREVVWFLLGAIAWVAFELLIAAAASTPAARLLQIDRLRGLGAAFLGAVTCAALAVRFGAALAWAPVIGGRPLPIVWSTAGAIAATALMAATRRGSATNP